MADMLAALRREALQALRPPRKLALSDWCEANVVLPASLSSQPGRMRLWPHQRAIADSIGDPTVERVSVLKSVRVGYSQLLTAAIGHYAANDPASVLVVLPADADSRTMMTSNIEPVFAESPALRSVISTDPKGRDIMLERRFPGGSLALVSARSPRNLRGRTARVLFLDEVDAFEVDVKGEGDPVMLAERRTLSYGDRKIVMGSTPVDEATSRICRAYAASDGRVYEVPCPSCGTFTELTWRMIEWEADKPATAAFRCPHCDDLVPETEKPRMVAGGHWRATRPEVVGHHGYRLNALVSLLPNAAWGKLAAEFVVAKRSPETLKTFVNTLLGEPWRDEGDEIDSGALASRAEPFGLDAIPAEVLVVTAGLDVQDDRVEITTAGWTKDGDALVLAHEVVWGSPLRDDTWAEVDDLLRRSWRHPGGGLLRVDAAIVDSGSGGHTDAVYGFCKPRTGRRVFAGKGVAGFSRKAVEPSKARDIRLMLVGVDAIKNELVNRLAAGRTIRFAGDLTETWFEQLAGERRIVRHVRGHPVRAFERIPGRRVEALDCLVYAFAARRLVSLDLERREEEIATPILPSRRPSVVRSAWLEGR
ncbi:phage terminase large subunit family protein [Aureimonas pseudogalii]|uniref:Phage terminase large subunit GpA-like protein n=1 Tax=Aureimonas pseudogalii TaxID=1744844 RepID=A0A7W6H5C3_9HYPH|nr:phage terminase large subunit family protein [Aureimonas pseudogalii]MBB3998867.1 phage terminase large subunit GpA-like protein [Aureimonas pseudogalii]